MVTSSPAAVNADAASLTTVKLSFNDDLAYNGSVSLTQGSYYGMGLPLTLGGVARTASASVWDQYGRARANQTVTFEQTTGDGAADNLTDSFTDDVTRVTNSSGVATLGFSDVNTATGAHTIWAWHEATTNGTRASNAAEPEASSVFYRIESNDLGSQTYNATSTEVDTGEAVAQIVALRAILRRRSSPVWLAAAGESSTCPVLSSSPLPPEISAFGRDFWG